MCLCDVFLNLLQTGVCSTSAGATDMEPDVAAEEQSDQAPPKGHLEGLTHQVS